MLNYLVLEGYDYRMEFPDDYDVVEDRSEVRVVVDNLSSLDTVDITTGLIASGSVVYVNGELFTFFSYKVKESNKYPGRDMIILFNNTKGFGKRNEN